MGGKERKKIRWGKNEKRRNNKKEINDINACLGVYDNSLCMYIENRINIIICLYISKLIHIYNIIYLKYLKMGTIGIQGKII